MKSNIRYTTAILAFTILIPSVSYAETVSSQTYVQPQSQPFVNEINFSVFDVNKDGFFSMKEVGDRLFESFDTDDNNLIDNNEWGKKTILTITPMEKEEYKFIDYDDDGYADKSVYTYKTFFQASGLARFDKNKDGLSAADFTEMTLLELDKDGDKLISQKEWEQAYRTSVEKFPKEDFNQ